jgi:hypothetical protein
VRKVFNRTLGAGVVLVIACLGAGPVPAPLQATARAGGVVAGHAAFNHGDFRGFGGQPLVRPGQMPPVVVSGGPAGINRPFGFEPARFHRRHFGFGLPVVGIGPSFLQFDEPIAYVGAIARSPALHAADDASLVPEGGERISVNRGGCRLETRIVASEAGGERPIRITWCHKG